MIADSVLVYQASLSQLEVRTFVYRSKKKKGVKFSQKIVENSLVQGSAYKKILLSFIFLRCQTELESCNKSVHVFFSCVTAVCGRIICDKREKEHRPTGKLTLHFSQLFSQSWKHTKYIKILIYFQYFETTIHMIKAKSSSVVRKNYAVPYDMILI